MTFEQLDYFIAAVKFDTFFEAAEALHITQSTLSKQIMKLERELNLQLLDRSRRSAALTEAGKMFYGEALELSRQYHQTLLHVKRFQQTSGQTLSIGTLPILTQYQLSSMLKSFSEQNPQIHMDIDEVEELELMSGLSQDKYDLVIARQNMTEKKHQFYPLVPDRLVTVLPLNHPLADRDCLSPEDISSEKMILMQPHTSIYQLCIRMFREADISPQILRTARMESIIGSVSINEGISLLPEGNLRLFQHEHVITVPLNPARDLTVGIIRKKAGNLSPAVSRFLNTVNARFPFPASSVHKN